ncbi:MAG: 2-phosphosulfolactate phosphatase [Phycisphaerales bacterium]|nr:2-phosphosulfolactate phosphatase [Phycisphaerales bacterium]
MKLDVAMLPGELGRFDLSRLTVVVFDVLRATTTMTAALDAGVSEIRIFDNLADARSAGERFGPDRILCGEQQCLPPQGFDLGNSPGAFHAGHDGRTLFMSTTNGTRAIVAAKNAAQLLIGSIINASAVARRAWDEGRDVLLLCAGTNGQVAMEDLIGCGAVLASMEQLGEVQQGADNARIARRLFESARADLMTALSQSQGGQNVIAAGLSADIEFAVRLDSSQMVGQVEPFAEGLRVKAIKSRD